MFRNTKRRISTVKRRKSWLFIRPNYTLTHKSKNARMGKGKGNFKRWCTIVKPGKVFLEHSNVPFCIYKLYVKKLNVKLKIHFKIVNLQSKNVKLKNVTNINREPTSLLNVFTIRKQLCKSLYH